MNTTTTDEKIKLIMRQTNYTEQEAREKMALFSQNAEWVIRDYLGIPIQKESEKSKVVKSSEYNQEIYRQFRYKLDSARRDYEERKELSQQKAAASTPSTHFTQS